jgi:hypothetical protein
MPRGSACHTASHSIRSDDRQCASMFHRIDGLDREGTVDGASPLGTRWAGGGISQEAYAASGTRLDGY